MRWFVLMALVGCADGGSETETDCTLSEVAPIDFLIFADREVDTSVLDEALGEADATVQVATRPQGVEADEYLETLLQTLCVSSTHPDDSRDCWASDGVVSLRQGATVVPVFVSQVPEGSRRGGTDTYITAWTPLAVDIEAHTILCVADDDLVRVASETGGTSADLSVDCAPADIDAELRRIGALYAPTCD